MNREIAVFVGNSISPEAQDRGLQTLTQAGFSVQRFDRDYPIPPGHKLGATAVIGGDGTVQTALTQLLPIDDTVPLVLIPSGTNNATHRAAQKIGAGTAADQLADWYEDTAHWKNFQPGLVGDLLPFSVDAWLGEADKNIAYYNSEFRNKVPTWSRSACAAARSWYKAAMSERQETPLLDMYTISSFFGKRTVFPKQQFNGENLTRLHISSDERGALGKLLLAFICLGTGNHQLLERAFPLTQAESFTLDYPIKNIAVNGSTKKLSLSQQTVGRSHKNIPVAAVIYDHQSKSR